MIYILFVYIVECFLLNFQFTSLHQKHETITPMKTFHAFVYPV